MTDVDTVGLKPCPFCGSDNVQAGGDDKVVGVWCHNCGATGPNGYLTINGNFEWNTRTIAAPPPAVPDEADLDERMKAAGMIPLSEMLESHGPMERMMQHAGVHTFDDFCAWIKSKQKSFMSMRMQYELGDKDKGDDLWEWVFAHAAVFDGIATQLRAITTPDPVAEAAKVILSNRYGGYGNRRAMQAMWTFVHDQHGRHMLPMSHYDGVFQAGLRALTKDGEADKPLRCAECDCENGGTDCNWIATPKETGHA